MLFIIKKIDKNSKNWIGKRKIRFSNLEKKKHIVWIVHRLISKKSKKHKNLVEFGFWLIKNLKFKKIALRTDSFRKRKYVNLNL